MRKQRKDKYVVLVLCTYGDIEEALTKAGCECTDKNIAIVRRAIESYAGSAADNALETGEIKEYFKERTFGW